MYTSGEDRGTRKGTLFEFPAAVIPALTICCFSGAKLMRVWEDMLVQIPLSLLYTQKKSSTFFSRPYQMPKAKIYQKILYWVILPSFANPPSNRLQRPNRAVAEVE